MSSHDRICRGCDKAFNTQHGFNNHINKCAAIVKIVSLEEELRMLCAVTRFGNRRFQFYEKELINGAKNPNYIELIQLIPQRFLQECAYRGRYGILPLCTYIYFTIPENRTVIHTEGQTNDIWTWNGREWQAVNRKDTLEMMLEFTFKIQADEYDRMPPSSKKNVLEPWYNYRNKLSFELTKKDFIHSLDVFIIDFYTRKILPMSYYTPKRKVKIILPDSEDDEQ
jgi:hypothetical protein